MENLPGVSVIVPAFQAEKTIESCIESLLELKYPKDKLELIIIDNNSTDGTKEKIKQYDVIYVW